MKFREHRGALNDAMETLFEFETRAQLLAHCRQLLSRNGFQFSDPHMHFFYQGFDGRIGWNTYLIVIQGYGPIGYTDGIIE